VEAGRMEIEKIPFSIHEVVQNVIDTSKYKAGEKGLRFEMKLGDKLPDVVKGDPTRLNQILTNLCSNAVKFTEKGGVTVEVTKPENSHFIKFRVTDTGIGIPADKVHLLFGNFKQVDSSTFRKYGGTGLGLAISKTLIELQGGKVEVESEPGKGSTFTVMIPYEQGTAEELKAMHHDTAADGSGLQGIRILVAEDNEYNQIVVEDTLTSLIEDVTIEIAENGLIAIDKVWDNDYDLVLMDAQMPEMDGLDATRHIRKMEDEKKRTLPIIALTASVHKADIDKCLESGMNSFVPKPFSNDELLGAIAQFYHNDKGTSKKTEPVKTQTEEGNSKKSAAGSGQVTDLGFLAEFTEGDKGRMRKYVELYLKLLPDNLKKLEAALAMNDGEALVSVMHAMRPHLNYMGMKSSANLAADVEKEVKEGAAVDEVVENVNQVLDHCSRSRIELEQELLTLA
jgi:CheY-like chemotaxis protein/HPt (histidine-containing phosphotransfer) domain-containing protein/anti-sigma regulatory factor (Ser/Thr protein kinase)